MIDIGLKSMTYVGNVRNFKELLKNVRYRWRRMPGKKISKKKIVDSSKKVCKNKDPSSLPFPFAFKKLPYRIQHSRPMDYRYLDYDYASFKCQQYGIKSARQYRSWQQFFKPAGFPSNPDSVYNLEWESWNDFLNNDNLYAGYDPKSVKASELLPYKDALIWTQSKQFKTVKDYKVAWDDGMILPGIPRNPQVRYKEFHSNGGWKMFLGKKLEHRLDAKKDLEPIAALCRTVGQSPNVLQLVISSQGIIDIQQQILAAPHLEAVKAYYWYHDYGTFVFELLDKMGTKQNENTWMFSDLNALYYELSAVLGEYRVG
jgi:hypothetical protein